MKEPSSEFPAPDPNEAAGENALRWAHARGVAARIAESARAQRRKRRQVRQVWAGGIAAALLTLGLWPWPPQPAESTPAPVTRATLVVSQPARQVLPDGSVVELKEGAAISVEYGPAARRVRLERGEAHFAVASDPAVPFIVSAGGVAVRAVGTAFAVGITTRSVEVLVTEGRVAVESATPATPELARLAAGQAAVVELAALVCTTDPAVPAEVQRSRLAWRVPRIELSRTPLAEVVECFNRYGAVRLELADPALGALQLSGVLRPDSPHALLHILRNDFGLRESRRADATIVLQRP